MGSLTLSNNFYIICRGPKYIGSLLRQNSALVQLSTKNLNIFKHSSLKAEQELNSA
jgi:hypothetical protein